MNLRFNINNIDHLASTSIEAEQSLLGIVLLYPDTLAACAGLLEPVHFSEHVHQLIFQVAQELAADGRPANPVTVCAKLGNQDIGGLKLSAYLAKLCAETSTPPAFVVDATRQVREFWALRQLIECSTDTLTGAKLPGASPKLIIGDLMQRLDQTRAMIDPRVSGFRTTKEVVDGVAERVAARFSGELKKTTITTGLIDLDRELGGGFVPGDLIVMAGRPGSGKTLTAGSIARQSAMAGHAGGFFSLEMTREQLGARLLSDHMLGCDGALASGGIMTGHLTQQNTELVIEASRELHGLPLAIDDSSSMTVGEISARTRSLADRFARAGKRLEFIAIDYLKFIRASDRYRGQRHYEVGEITAGLKGLAKDVNIAVILLAQLNRQVEARDDKRPFLSDLRECVVGSTRLIDAVSGRWTPIKDLLIGSMIMALDIETQKIKPFEVRDVWSTGIKETFKLTTQTGRQIMATDNHPFLTEIGWRALGDLRSGDVIGTALRLPDHGKTPPVSAERCRLLGYMVGDGTYQKHRSVGFISSDKECFADVLSIVAKEFPNVTASKKNKRGNWEESDFVCVNSEGYGRPYGNPLREWLREIGIHGERESTKRVPEFVFQTKELASEFLAGYLASDGCVKCNAKGTRKRVWEIHFDTTSRGLASDVQALLLRVGIISSIGNGYKSKVATKPIYRVNVANSFENMRAFANVVQCRGKKGALLSRMLLKKPAAKTGPGIFSLPRIVSAFLGILSPQRVLEYGKVRLGFVHQNKRPRRDNCLAWAERLGRDDLKRWATSDILWETIRSIEPAGQQEVFDISVPGCANFIGEGIVAHNSGDLESDSDVVMFLYRPSYYLEGRAPMAGTHEHGEWELACAAAQNKLEIIIAKQRMGTTGTINVYCNPAASAVRDRQHSGGL